MHRTIVNGEQERWPGRGPRNDNAVLPDPEEEPRHHGVYKLDLSGVPCPNSFVRAKWKMESMAIGETLILILDGGEAIRNVPGSFLREGQEVVQMTASSGGCWRLIVRKASSGGVR